MIRVAMVVAGLAALLVRPALAEPSLRGYTGLIEIPTADALDRGAYNFGFNIAEVEGFDAPNYLGNYGVADGLEVGLFWHHPEHHDAETLINLKHRFATGRGSRPSFAVGIADLTDEEDTTVYAVGTWDLARPRATVKGMPLGRLRLHAGVAGGMIDGIFLGAEARLGERVNVMAEYLNSDFNLGARVRVFERFSAQASLLDMSDFAIGGSYNWPLGRRISDLEPIAASSKASEKVWNDRVVQPPPAPKQTAAKGPAEARPEEPAAPIEVAKAEPEASEPPPPAPAKVEPAAEPETPAEPPKPEEPPAAPEAAEETPASATPAEPEKPVQPETPAEEALAAAQPAEPVPPPPPVEPEAPRDPFADYAEVDDSKPEVAIPLGACPEVEGGELCVPVRAVAQWLGFRVNAQTSKRGIEVTVFAGQDAVSFLIGDDRARHDGETVNLPGASYYANQRTAMVPAKLFRVLGVPTVTDVDAKRALFERHDAIGVAECGK